jgi:hypothetical protein
MLRGLATMSSIVGAMRAVRAYSSEPIENSDNVEKGEAIIDTKVIPMIEACR